MQTDPIDRSCTGDPQLDHRQQLKRWLLLELLSYPPAAGDDLDYLTRTLNEQRVHVESAIDDLVVDGLAERDGDRVRASAAAWRFDALWPVRP
jgi:hypothetical protein